MCVLKKQCSQHNLISISVPALLAFLDLYAIAAAATPRCRRRRRGLLPDAQGVAVELRLAAVRVPAAIADHRRATVLAPRRAPHAGGDGREV